MKARASKEEVGCRRSPVSRVPGPVDLAEVSRRTGGAGIPHHRISGLGRCPLAPPRREFSLAVFKPFWPTPRPRLGTQNGGRRRRSSASGGFPPAEGRRPRGGVDCTDRTVGSRRCESREGRRGAGTSRTLLSRTGCPRPLSLLESQAEHGKEAKALDKQPDVTLRSLSRSWTGPGGPEMWMDGRPLSLMLPFLLLAWLTSLGSSGDGLGLIPQPGEKCECV